MQDEMIWNWVRRGSPIAAGELRVSDAERAEVTDALSKHYADGRLDQAEMQERVAQALAAKTRNQLVAVLVDLPPLGAPTPAPRVRRGPSLMFVALVLVVFIAAIPAFATPHVPWLAVLVVALIVSRGRRWHRHRRWNYGSDHD